MEQVFNCLSFCFSCKESLSFFVKIAKVLKIKDNFCLQFLVKGRTLATVYFFLTKHIYEYDYKRTGVF